jgi:hypothetical protein
LIKHYCLARRILQHEPHTILSNLPKIIREPYYRLTVKCLSTSPLCVRPNTFGDPTNPAAVSASLQSPADTLQQTALFSSKTAFQSGLGHCEGGLIVLEHATTLDFDILGLNSIHPPMRRDPDQHAEDKLCQRLLLLGASGSIATIDIHSSQASRKTMILLFSRSKRVRSRRRRPWRGDGSVWLTRVDWMAEFRSRRMNTIGEMTLNPCNIPASAILKRQVSLRRKVKVQISINSSLNIRL